MIAPDTRPLTRNAARGAVLAAALCLIATLVGAAPVARADRSRMVSGWFGYWTDASTMVSVARSSRGVLGEVNIFWWEYRGSSHPLCTSGISCPAGTSRPYTSGHLSRALRGLHRLGITVFGTHTDLDGGLAGSLSDYLATRHHRRAFAQRLTSWAVAAGVDGVDLDWENFAFNDGSDTWATTRPRLTDTVRRLSRKLHAHGKLLSVTVPGGYQPFLAGGRPNPGGGYTVYSWRRMAPYLDRLRLMTYDYSWDRPGPIGPQPWAAAVVRSAIAQVGPGNRGKIYVGLHQYGKAWYTRDADDNVVTVGRCPANWQPYGSDAIALTPQEAVAVARTYGARPRFDRRSKEWTFGYVKTESGYWYRHGRQRDSDCRVRKQIWWGGRATAVARGRLVRRYHIGGIATWSLATLANRFFSSLAPFVPQSARTRGPRLELTATSRFPKAGSAITLTGRLRPRRGGVTVKRQQLVAGQWRTMSLRTSSAAGVVHYRVPLPRRAGTLLFRLKQVRTPGQPAVLSPQIAIHTRR